MIEGDEWSSGVGIRAWELPSLLSPGPLGEPSGGGST